MSHIIEILDSAMNLELEDEDGNRLKLEASVPASERDLNDREGRLGVKIPLELRDLLMFANGLSLFGQVIMSLQEQDYFSNQGLLSFHNWGNGDFDCVAASSSKYPENTVVFMNHGPEISVKIEDNLTAWFEKAINEIRERGVLLHPGDYIPNSNADSGLYGGVLAALEGIDCELNR